MELEVGVGVEAGSIVEGLGDGTDSGDEGMEPAYCWQLVLDLAHLTILC